jgi:hypothetical protein
MRHPEVDVYALTLARAAALSGGSDELAKKLHVTPAQIEAWISGADGTPHAIFLQVVDLVTDAMLASLRVATREVTAQRR